MKNKKIRNSSIELLRIVAMIMIIFHHFSLYGNFSYNLSKPGIPLFWYNFIIIGGKVGVDIFVLITGYFLVTSNQGFNLKRILKFWGQLLFYSVLFFIIGMIINKSASITLLIKAFLPIRSGGWWFAKTYFVLYLFHPFINLLLQKLDKKKYQWLLVLMVFSWSVVPSFLLDSFEVNELIWFVVLYAVAGYERL